MLVHRTNLGFDDHSAAFSGDRDWARSIEGCAFWVGGEAGFDGGEVGPSFSRPASALTRVSTAIVGLQTSKLT